MRGSRSVRFLVAGVVLGLSGVFTACDWADGDGGYICRAPAFCDVRLNDAREKASDVGEYLAVQRGDEMASGSTVLGQSGPLGGRKVALSIRAGGLKSGYPQIGTSTIGLGGTVNSTAYPVTAASAVLVSAGAAVRLWRGFRSGTTRVGEFDLIGGLTILPDAHPAGWTIKSAGRDVIEVGGRLGVIEETRNLPGVAVSLTHRVAITAAYALPVAPTADGGSMAMTIDNLDVGITSWRVSASKRIGAFGVDAGYGTDRNASSFVYSATLSGSGAPASGQSSGGMQLSRENGFIGVSYTVHGVSLSGEYGRIGGHGGFPPQVANSFGGDLLKGRSYYSVGIRVGH